MPANPPENMPRIIPYLFYEDVAAALDWLARTFGFRERSRMAGPEGKIVHAEMELADAVIMLGCPGPEFESPKRHGRVYQLQYVYVDDVDKHFERAQREDAVILDEPADQFYGDRRYSVEDLEGHRWNFAQRVRDVAPEDMKPPA